MLILFKEEDIMKREVTNIKELENVVGGTIFFSEDHKTCGYFCTNQYSVNDFDAAIGFIREHSGQMSERNMLKKMEANGYITSL